MAYKSDTWEATIRVPKKTTAYLGDYCYVLTDEEYDGLESELERTYYKSVETDSVICHSTFDGDGTYPGLGKDKYPVDSGHIGVVIDTGNNIDHSSSIKGVTKFSVNAGDILKLTYNDGKFSFYINGDLEEIIQTGNDDDEDDED